MLRRHVLSALLAGPAALALGSEVIAAKAGKPGPAAGTGYGQWYDISNDEGRPLANLRLPVELVTELEAMSGVAYVGATEPEVTVYEFFDYNCPFCRVAAADLPGLLDTLPGVRVGLVNNPVLSPQSAQAAKVALAVLRRGGPKITLALYRRLFALPGRMDGTRALDAAGALGGPRAELETLADGDPIRDTLRAQMRLAASLGLNATPSYVAGTVGILGYPGRRSLAGIAQALRTCGQVTCTG